MNYLRMNIGDLEMEIDRTRTIYKMYVECAQDKNLSTEDRMDWYNKSLECAAYLLKLESHKNYLETKQAMFDQPLVRETIAAIRIMWDCRDEKDLYHRVNWLTGMDEIYDHVLSLLFGSYAEGHETPKTFAMRIAGIKK